MELWLEYLKRRNLPIIRPFVINVKQPPQMYVKTRPPYELQVWALFLACHRHIVDMQEWENCIMTCQDSHIPTFGEQRQIIFGRVPMLEELWEDWQDGSFNALTLPLTVRIRRFSPTQLNLLWQFDELQE